MQKLEDFQYVTTLYLKMGYYNIRLSPASKDMTTIVTEFGKSNYNCLTIGMCASGDILQVRVEEIIGDIEGVKTYINNILVLNKESFSKHIGKLRIIFSRLRAAGLKFNAPKCIFGFKEITYL